MKNRDSLFVVLVLGFVVYWGITFLGLGLTHHQVLAQDRQASALLKHLDKLREANNSYQADFSASIEDYQGKTTVTKGTFKFKWPNKRWMKVWRVKDNKFLGLSVSNGEIEWVFSPGTNTASKHHLKALDEDAQQKGWVSADPLDEASIVYVGKESLGREQVYVFEGKPSAILLHENPDPPGKTRLYIGSKDGIFRKVSTYDLQGRETGSQTYTNIQIDAEISEEDFEYVPPKGTRVIEYRDVGSRINPNQ